MRTGRVSRPESADAETLRDPYAGSGPTQEGPSQIGEYSIEILLSILLTH